MQVAQRSTSVTGVTANGYNTADRWNVDMSSLGTWTQSVENDAPTGSGFRKSLKVLCTTADASPAAGDFKQIQQRIEGQNLQHILKGTSSAKELTFSFWVKSNVTGTYIVELFDVDNTRQVSKSYTINASATWEKKTITFSADTTGAFDNDNANSFQITFWLGAGTTYASGTLNTSWASKTDANRAVGQTNLAASTNNYWQITGVQLEVGSTATEFEFLPAQVELALCQRYFQRMGYDNESYTFYSVGSVQTTTNSIFIIPLITQMRTAPAVTFINPTNLAINDSTNNVSVSSASCIRPTVFNLGEVSVNVTGGTHTIGRGCRLLSNNQTNTQIQSRAEL
jgi:hypothetical protein